MIDALPSDWRDAVLVGRAQTRAGPVPVVISGGRARDVSRFAPTVSDLLNGWTGGIPPGADLGAAERLVMVPSYHVPPGHASAQELRLLAPFDLQCIKA